MRRHSGLPHHGQQEPGLWNVVYVVYVSEILDMKSLTYIVGLYFLQFFAGRGHAGPPAPIFEGSVPVFYRGLNFPGLGESINCFRIPTIIKSSSGVLLAFSENRTKSCHDHVGEHAIVLRRSLDHGETWGPLILVAKDLKPPCPHCPKVPSIQTVLKSLQQMEGEQY